MRLSVKQSENESSRDLDRCHLIDIDDTNSVRKKRKNRRKGRKKSSKPARMSTKKKKKRKSKSDHLIDIDDEDSNYEISDGFVALVRNLFCVNGIIIILLGAAFGASQLLKDSDSSSIGPSSYPSPSPTFIVTQSPTRAKTESPTKTATSAPTKIATPAPVKKVEICCDENNQVCRCGDGKCTTGCKQPNVFLDYANDGSTNFEYLRGSETNWIKDYNVSISVTFDESRDDGKADLSFDGTDGCYIRVSSDGWFDESKANIVTGDHKYTPSGELPRTPLWWGSPCIGNTVNLRIEVGDELRIKFESVCYENEFVPPVRAYEKIVSDAECNFLGVSVAIQSINAASTFNFTQ